MMRSPTPAGTSAQANPIDNTNAQGPSLSTAWATFLARSGPTPVRITQYSLPFRSVVRQRTPPRIAFSLRGIAEQSARSSHRVATNTAMRVTAEVEWIRTDPEDCADAIVND